MLFEVLGDIWVVERNPYLQDDLLDNPKRRRLLVDALHHRLDEIDKRRRHATGADAGARRARSRKLVERGASRGRRFASVVPRHAALRKRARARARRGTRARTTSRSTAWRACRTSPTRPTGASSIRSSCSIPDTEEEVRGLVEGCIELGLTIIPRGGGTGYTGGADSARRALSAVINTEKLERLSARSSTIAAARASTRRSRRSTAARAW